MSDKSDQKLESVVLAQFQYRHEAEFAAGFLDDAEIPYRMQVDDPALGMTIATPATIWVRAMDLERAREVLDLPALEAISPAQPPRKRPPPVRPRGAEDVIRFGGPSDDRLSGPERALAMVLAAACLGGGWWVLTGSGETVWAWSLAVLAAPFLVAALVGRALAPVRALLRALSGRAP